MNGTAKGFVRATLKQHKDRVKTMASDHRHDRVFSGSYDQSVIVWDASKHKKVEKVRVGGEVLCVVYCESTNELILSSYSEKLNLIEIFDLSVYKRINSVVAHEETIFSLAVNESDNTIASGCEDGFIKIWNKNDLSCLHTIEAHKGCVRTLTFDMKGKRLITGGYDGRVLIWGVDKYNLLQNNIGHTDIVFTVAVSRNNKYLASGSQDRSLRLWDLNANKRIRRMERHNDGVWCLAFSPNSVYLISGGGDWQVIIWKVSSGKPLYNLQGPTNGVTSVALSKEGHFLYAGGLDATIIHWNLHRYLSSNETNSVNQLEHHYKENKRKLVNEFIDDMLKNEADNVEKATKALVLMRKYEKNVYNDTYLNLLYHTYLSYQKQQDVFKNANTNLNTFINEQEFQDYLKLMNKKAQRSKESIALTDPLFVKLVEKGIIIEGSRHSVILKRLLRENEDKYFNDEFILSLFTNIPNQIKMNTKLKDYYLILVSALLDIDQLYVIRKKLNSYKKKSFFSLCSNKKAKPVCIYSFLRKTIGSRLDKFLKLKTNEISSRYYGIRSGLDSLTILIKKLSQEITELREEEVRRADELELVKALRQDAMDKGPLARKELRFIFRDDELERRANYLLFSYIESFHITLILLMDKSNPTKNNEELLSYILNVLLKNTYFSLKSQVKKL